MHDAGIPRRTFLKGCARAGGAAALIPRMVSGEWVQVNDGPKVAPRGEEHLVEARYYDKLPHRKIKCTLCPRECLIDDLERGYCGVRENRDGTYYTLVHARPCSWHADPIEKKPLFHFLPGTLAYSIATVGCNVECKFCQNWDISQLRPELARNYDMPPEEVVGFARQKRCRSIAYTYSEPVIFYEYMYDTAELGRTQGVRSVMISNGYIQAEPMRALCGVLDAVKIDLKAYTETFYRDVCAGKLKPVLDTLELLVEEGMWTEIVYLMIPTLNDDRRDIRKMCRWIRTALGPEVPVHFTRFHPQYKLKNLPSTPVKTLDMAREIALDQGLHYVYVGNVPGHDGENTYCPNCGEIVIKRMGYFVQGMHVKDGKCGFCGNEISGVWE